MKLNQEWEKEWQEIDVPQDKVQQAIEAAFKQKSEKQAIKKKVVPLKKYRKVLVSVAVAALLATGAYAVFKEPTSLKETASQAPQTNPEQVEKQEVEPKANSEIWDNQAPSAETKGTVEFKQEAGEEASSQEKSIEGAGNAERLNKIIKTYRIEKETNQFEANLEAIKKELTTYQGYISNSAIESQNDYFHLKTAEFEMRIPKEQTTAFLEAIAKHGQTVRSTESTDDQSLYYSDNQTRIEALVIEEKALLKLLEKSEEISDMMAIQDRLSVIRGEKDSLIQQNKLVDNQVAESTIYLSLTEVEKITKEKSSSIKSNVKNNWQKQVAFWSATSKKIIVFLLSNGLYLLLASAGIGYAWFKLKKKKRGNPDDD